MVVGVVVSPFPVQSQNPFVLGGAFAQNLQQVEEKKQTDTFSELTWMLKLQLKDIEGTLQLRMLLSFHFGNMLLIVEGC